MTSSPKGALSRAVEAASLRLPDPSLISKQQLDAHAAVEAALEAVLKAELPDLAEVNDEAALLARDHAASLIVGLSQTNERVVRMLVGRALEQGWSDALLEKRIAEKVGLDPRSAQAVENYRRGLVEAGKPPGAVDRQARAYANRLRKHRARVIARTETQQALMEAQRGIWKRQQEAGDISRWAVRVTRIHKDERLCVVCRRENGKRRSLKAPDGPPFHPNCRCYEDLVDEGVEKAAPEGAALYVLKPVMVLDERPPKKTKKKKRDGSMVPMDDVSKVSSHAYPSLERVPGKQNWVDEAGGLPSYIERIAKHLHYERGMPIGRAIAVAVSRCKMWAGGGDNVDPDTRAKAAKAIAEWEAKKAKAHAKDDD